MMKDYYLDQMGIERWVKRPLCTVADVTPILVICETGLPCVGQAETLFQNMLACIGMTLSQVRYTTSERWYEACKARKPKAIFAMTPIEESRAAALNIPVIDIQHPNELLQHQSGKKQAYHALLSISVHCH